MKILKPFVGFQEVPDEVSLILPFTGCGGPCVACHSPELHDPTNGVELTHEYYMDLLEEHKGLCTCITYFLWSIAADKRMFPWMVEQAHRAGYNTCIYNQALSIPYTTYCKTGPYIEELGGLDSPTTNQRMIDNRTGEDITYKFRRELGNNKTE